MNKKLRLLLLGIILGLTFIPITLPNKMQNKITDIAEEYTGRKVQLGDVKYNILRNIIYVDKFAIYEKNDTDVFISFDSFDINLDLFPLLYHKLKLSDITLKNPNLSLEYDKDKANYMDIIDSISKHSTGDNTKEKQGDTESFIKSVEVKKVKIESFTFRYKDKVVSGKNIFTINIPELLYSNEELKFDGDIDFFDKGKLEVQGEYHKNRQKYSLSIKSIQLLLDDKLYLIKAMNKLKSIDGIIDSNLQIEGDIKKKLLKIDGFFKGSNLKVITEENKELLDIKTINTNIIDISPLENRYIIEEVVVEDTFFDIDNVNSYLKSIGNNTKKQKNGENSSTKTINKEEKNPFIVFELDKLDLENLQIKNTTGLYKINVEGSDLGTKKGSSKFNLKSRYNNESETTIKLHLNKIKDIESLEDIKTASGNVEIKNFTLSMFDYIFRESKSELNGNLNIMSNFKYLDDHIQSTNKILFSDININEADARVEIKKLESNNQINISNNNFSFQGDLSGDDFNIVSSGFMSKLKKLDIDVNKITKEDIKIKNIVITEPKIKVEEIKSSKKNTVSNEKTPVNVVFRFFEHLFFSSGIDNITEDVKNEKIDIPINIDIDKFMISKGSFDYKYPKLKISLTNIDVKVDNFTSAPNKKITFKLTSDFNRSGDIKGNGSLILRNNWDFRPKTLTLHSNLELIDINLLVFKELAKENLPNELVSGTLTYRGNTNLKDGIFDGKNNFILKNFYLGKKTEVSSPVPLKVSTELMKNVHGNIVLDVPISGDFNDPKFSLNKVFVHEIINLLMNVTSSPIKIMNTVFNLKEGEIKKINYNYLEVKPIEMVDLSKIAKILGENDNLKVKFILATNSEEEDSKILEKRKAYLKSYFKDKKVEDLVEVKISNFDSEKAESSVELIVDTEEKNMN